MPANIEAIKAEAIKKVTKTLNHVFKEQDRQLSSIGGNTKLPEFNSTTGTWQASGRTAKSPRYLLQAQVVDGQVQVGNFIETILKGRIGAFNGVMRGFKGVPGVLVRLHLLFVQPDDKLRLFADWEWLVLILFTRAQVGGTSSDALSGFLPPKATISLAEKEISLATVQLYGLLPGTETTTVLDEIGEEVTITYQQATTAIQNYLTFDYSETSTVDASIPHTTQLPLAL